MLEKVDGDITIIREEGAVYVGWFTNLKLVTDELEWTESSIYGYPCQSLTLDEIRSQLTDKLITVYEDGDLCGTFYQYGNYDDRWYMVGETAGYA